MPGERLARFLVTRLVWRNLVAEMREDEEANGGRQVAVLPGRVDGRNDLGQGHAARPGDFLQRLPERVFEANAGLVTGNDDRALDDRGFHFSSPVARRVSPCLLTSGLNAPGAWQRA